MHQALVRKMLIDMDAFFGTDHSAIYQDREYFLKWHKELMDADEELCKKVFKILEKKSGKDEKGLKPTLQRFMFELRLIDPGYGKVQLAGLADCDICKSGWRYCLIAGDLVHTKKMVCYDTGLNRNRMPAAETGIYKYYQTMRQPCCGCDKGRAVNAYYFKYPVNTLEALNANFFKTEHDLATHFMKFNPNLPLQDYIQREYS